MQGTYCRFYVRESERHQGRPLWEWLLTEANRLGLRGGSAYRAMAGFGRHHVLAESHFFELAGNLGVEVEFMASEAEAAALLEVLERERIHIPFALVPARFGVVGEDAAGSAP